MRETIKHFRKKWGPKKGSNRYRHDVFAGSKDGQRSNATLARRRASVEGEPRGWGEQIFPRGEPQKQGYRLAGLLRTKGEH